MIKILKQFITLLILVALASSCIPNEKVVYLQNEDLSKRLSNDSLIKVSRVDYKLQSHDILLISFYSAVEEAVEKF